PLGHLNAAATVQCRNQLRIEAVRPVVVGKGTIVVELVEAGIPASMIGDGGLGIELDDSIVVGERTIVFADAALDVAFGRVPIAAEEGSRTTQEKSVLVVRLEPDQSVEVGDGAVIVLLFHIRRGTLVERVLVVGPQRENLIVVGD